MANAACPTSIHVCRARITRLNQTTGAVASGGTTNHYVTDKLVSIEAAPEIKEGDSKEITSGCDCICVSYKGNDKLLRFNLTLTLCALEPELIELLTGANLLVNGSSQGIGGGWANQLSCSSVQQQPMVAIEAWSHAWVGDGPYTAYPFIRWVWKGAFFQWDTLTLENELQMPTLKGFSRANAGFGNAYVDYPTGVTTLGSDLGGWVFDTAAPAAYCGYSPTST
jgi:hypothetical protein